MRTRVAAALVLMVLAMVPEPAGASDTNLSINASYNAYPTPDPLCQGFRVYGEGETRGAPVGVATWRDDECATVTAAGRVVVQGCLKLTNEAGVLVATYQASSPPPDAGGYLRFQGTFTTVGGDGRFTGAGGSGVITAVANLFSPGATAHMEGSYQPQRSSHPSPLRDCPAASSGALA